MLQLENLTIHRGHLCVARNFNLQLEPGKVYAVLGPNGAGKSSLLKALFAEIPYEGHIHHRGQPLVPALASLSRKHFAYMPQDTVMDASLTALEVVLLGQLDALSLHVSDEQLQRAIATMELLGIAHLADRDVLALSGGQRQMVIFAQVLLRNPEILLLDEPVSALDMHHQCVLLEHVRQQTRQNQLITITILHDLNLASQFADELIFVGDGQVQALGEPAAVIEQALIERLYRVRTALFHGPRQLPFIVAQEAL